MDGIPKIYGLVLAGGKSTRMGSDKGRLNYRDRPQQEYLHGLLKELCEEVYLSIREEQRKDIPETLKTLVDEDRYRGPFNGILTAHGRYPEVAWLVLACDLPLMNLESLRELVGHRNPDKWATSLATRESGLPEPMATLWEPQGLQGAVEYLRDSESTCPRKFLINSDIALLHPHSDEVLYNANSLADFEYAKRRLNHGS